MPSTIAVKHGPCDGRTESRTSLQLDFLKFEEPHALSYRLLCWAAQVVGRAKRPLRMQQSWPDPTCSAVTNYPDFMVGKHTRAPPYSCGTQSSSNQGIGRAVFLPVSGRESMSLPRPAPSARRGALASGPFPHLQSQQQSIFGFSLILTHLPSSQKARCNYRYSFNNRVPSLRLGR